MGFLELLAILSPNLVQTVLETTEPDAGPSKRCVHPQIWPAGGQKRPFLGGQNGILGVLGQLFTDFGPDRLGNH